MSRKDSPLVDDTVTIRLIKMILDLSKAQRLKLLQQIEEMAVIASLKDQRGHMRKSLATTISFSAAKRFYSGISRDISNNGMFIQTKGDFMVGQVIDLSMPFANQNKPIQSQASIVRVSSGGIGVEFIKRQANP